MSSDENPKVIDNTNQEKTSEEAILILAVVLGFFLSILIVLCILRHRETVKKLLTTRGSSKGSHSREQGSRTASLGPHYLGGTSITDGSLELISDGRMMLARDEERARYIRYPQNSSNYYQYHISDNRPPRKSQQSEYSASDGRSPVIIPREKVFYLGYESAYDKSTRCASEATDFSTSMEKMEEYEPRRMHEEHVKRKQYPRYNYRPEGRLAMNYPESAVTANSLLEISLSDITVRSTGGRPNHHKWQFLGNDTASVSSISTYSAEVLSPHHGSGRRIKGQRPVIDEDVYADSRTNRERRNPVRVQIPSRSATNRETVDIAVHTPFFEVPASTTMSTGITDPRFADGRRDALRNPENQRSSPHNAAMVYTTQEAEMTAHGYGKEEERIPRRVHTGETPRMMTSGGVHEVPSSTWLVSEEETSAIGHRQAHQRNRGSIEIFMET